MDITTNNITILKQKLISISKILPLHSDEVVKISQELDYHIVQVLKKQIKQNYINV